MSIDGWEDRIRSTSVFVALSLKETESEVEMFGEQDTISESKWTGLRAARIWT